MQGLFSLHETRVLYDGRELLGRTELASVVTHSMRRKLRLAGFDRDFWKELRERGESALTWNFSRHNARNERSWVSFQAWAASEAAYRLYCIGPKAEYAIERVNKVLADKTPKWLRKKLEGKTKRRKKRKSRKAVHGGTPKGAKKNQGAVPSHALVMQFRHSPIAFTEAIELCVFAGQVKREARRSAREVVASELYRSLEHTKDAFAQFRTSSFRLHFRFVREPEIGDRALPPVRVWCAKDGSKEYRRVRKWLHRKLLGLTNEERHVRRHRLGLQIAA